VASQDEVYQAAVAEIQALDGRTPEQREQRRRIRKAREMGACAACNRKLEPGEPVWMCVFSDEGRFGRTWMAAVVCAACYAETFTSFDGRYTYRRHRLAGWHSRWAITGAWSCKGCGRQVHAHSHRVATYCTESCKRAAANQRRRVESAARTCPCGRSFTASRSDAVYCSNACRQRAYRQRGGE
jgi:hypothetical protein